MDLKGHKVIVRKLAECLSALGIERRKNVSARQRSNNWKAGSVVTRTAESSDLLENRLIILENLGISYFGIMHVL